MLVGFISRVTHLAWVNQRVRKLPPLDLYDVCHSLRRVMPGDIDELRHMNNGAYLTNLDHARVELVIRTGMWKRLEAADIYPVVSAQSIAYRKSLKLWQKYTIESRMLGLDERSVYMEQRFVVDGEVYARAFIQARFLYKAGGTVSVEKLAEVTGIDPMEHPIPEWLHEWAAEVRLPPTRQPAPSTWV